MCGSPGGSSTHVPAIFLLQPPASTRFWNFYTKKKKKKRAGWGYSLGVPCSLPDVSTLGCPLGFLNGAGFVISVLGEILSTVRHLQTPFIPWHLLCFPHGHEGDKLWISLLSLSSLIFSLCSDYAVNNFDIIFCVSLHLDERHCTFHTFLCVDG